MRLISVIVLPLVMFLTDVSAEARVRGVKAHHDHRASRASDMDLTLRRRAAADRARGWMDWEVHRPLSSYLPPVTKQRVSAPPFTGWGYGETIPGAWPGF